MNHERKYGKTWQPTSQKCSYSTSPIPEREPLRKNVVQSNSAFIQQQPHEERHKKSPVSKHIILGM